MIENKRDRLEHILKDFDASKISRLSRFVGHNLIVLDLDDLDYYRVRISATKYKQNQSDIFILCALDIILEILYAYRSKLQELENL